MKLYFAPGSCSLATHIVLHELGLPHDLARVNTKTKRTSEGGDFLAVTPKGYVAALVLDGGEVLTELPALVQYLADQKPEGGLAPPAGTLERARLQEWLNYISAELHAKSGPLFDPTLPDAVRESFQAKLTKKLDLPEQRLGESAYLLGDRFTVADAGLFAVLGWMPDLGIELHRFPNLIAFIERIAARPSVAAARAMEAEFPPVA